MKLIAPILLTLVLFSQSQFAGAQTDSTTLVKAGDKMPVFTVSNSTHTIDSHQLENKIVWINFFATWCGPCRKELPELQKRVWDEFKANPKFALMVIGRQHTKDEVETFAKAQNYTMPFYPDPDRAVYGMFATSFIPRNVIVDEKGTVIYSTIGFEESEFAAMIAFVRKKLKEN